MKGIYKFTNIFNNKCYIGQSINLENRYKAHKRNYNNPKINSYNTIFYRALRKYGFKNFKYEILEQSENFTKEELNQLEIFYINYYNSFREGYNMNLGGNFTSSEKKLNSEKVLKIKWDIIKTDKTFTQIAEEYNVKISLISLINTGKVWNYIGNFKYPLRKTTSARKGKNNGMAKITDNEVMNIRKKFVYSDLNTIYKEYKNILSFSEIKKIVYGQQFKHLPVYKKRRKQWILNEACIDYPLGWNAGE